MIHFNNPWVLALIVLALIPPLAARLRNSRAVISYPYDALFGQSPLTARIFSHKALPYIRALVIVLVVIALARPQLLIKESIIERLAVDMVLAVDVSTSMLAEDFTLKGKRVNRLAVVKDVVDSFIRKRTDDRIGIIAFAAEAYTVAPLTFDYDWVLENLGRLETGLIEDGTAIGSALGSALNRLKDSKAKSKIVILLTDGRNNAGILSPQTAAEAAGALGVKVYTIGAGTKGAVPYPATNMFGNKTYRNVVIEIDDALLKNIADKTGGQYYRATDTESLQSIYDEINKLEKTAIKEHGYMEKEELMHLFILPALFLLLMELLLRRTIARVLPA